MFNKILLILIILFSAITNAEIIISGPDAILQTDTYDKPQKNSFLVPKENFYLQTEQVELCHIKQRPEYTPLHAMSVEYIDSDTDEEYYCYNYDPYYFKMK